MPQDAGPSGGSHSAGGVAGGMRRRPIDVHRKLPLVRSSKELTLDDDTAVANEVVREPSLASTLGRAAGSPALGLITQRPLSEGRAQHPAGLCDSESNALSGPSAGLSSPHARTGGQTHRGRKALGRRREGPCLFDAIHARPQRGGGLSTPFCPGIHARVRVRVGRRTTSSRWRRVKSHASRRSLFLSR